MKTLALAIFGLLAWIGCEDTKNLSGDTLQTEAVLVDNIAVDGCAAHFEVSTSDTTLWCGASAATEKVVSDFLRKESPQYGVYSIPVVIKYRETSKSKTIQCGWGKTRETDEIEVVSIRNK